VEELRTINVSFPGMQQPAGPRNSAGYNREPLPDLRTLFAGESKEQGFLKLTTFFDPAAAFSMAQVRVLKQRVEGQLKMPLVPTAPGGIAARGRLAALSSRWRQARDRSRAEPRTCPCPTQSRGAVAPALRHLWHDGCG